MEKIMKRTLCLSLALLFAGQSATAMTPYQKSMVNTGLTWVKSQVSSLQSKLEPVRHWVKEHPVLSVAIFYGGMAAVMGLTHLCKMVDNNRRKAKQPTVKKPSNVVNNTTDAKHNDMNDIDSFKFSFVRQESLDLKTKEIYIKNRKGKFSLIPLSEVTEPYIEIVYNTNNQALSRVFSMGAIQAKMNLDVKGKLTIEFPEAVDTRVDYYVYVPLAMKNTVITYYQAK